MRARGGCVWGGRRGGGGGGDGGVGGGEEMGGDSMRFIEAQQNPRRPTLYSVSTSGAACPGQSPVTPPDRVLSPPCETGTI